MRFYPLLISEGNLKIDFLGLRKFNYVLSAIFILASTVLIFSKGLNLGIDFAGGISIDVKISESFDLQLAREKLNALNLGEVVMQTFGIDEINIRCTVTEGNVEERIKKIQETISSMYKSIEYRKIDFVGPQVGNTLILSGAKAMALAFLGIMIYIWIRFEWQFGLGILVALLHDLILSLGFMSLTWLEFNLSSIAALLTIIGYSVNDSVVIYDRIRENIIKYPQYAIDKIINISVNDTISRTTLTVFTTILANIAIVIFGGEAIRSFAILVLFGIVAGTYSSIFISAPILTIFKIERFK